MMLPKSAGTAHSLRSLRDARIFRGYRNQHIKKLATASFFMCESAGTRTQDTLLKRQVL